MSELAIKNFRDKVVVLEEELLASVNVDVVKGNSDFFPLTHSFSDGVYIREMKMGKGGMVVGKIHNRSHTWFLMQGHLIIATESGSCEYKAPIYINSKIMQEQLI